MYPAYGAGLTRNVVRLQRGMIREIPGDAKWVAIDYSPRTPGQATESELRFFNELRADGRFQLVYRNEQYNQAVFQRTK